MTSDRLAYFQFYPRDFTSDDAVECMETEAVGAYLLLLCKAWHQIPAGTLPNDDLSLAKWARLSSRKWKQHRESVLRAFYVGEDGRLHQKRMEAEYAKALETLSKRSKAGAEAAAARWERNANACESHTNRTPNASESQCERNANAMRFDAIQNQNQIQIQNQIQNQEEKTPLPPKGGAASPRSSEKFDPMSLRIPPELDCDEFRSAWASWAKHRAEIKSPLKATMADQQLRKLAAIGLTRAVAMIEHTIASGWVGLREPEISRSAIPQSTGLVRRGGGSDFSGIAAWMKGGGSDEG